MSNTTHLTSAEILAQALVSDSPEIMQLDQLDPDTKLHIVTARLHGYHPVSVRWSGGEFALLLCEPGTNMPEPHKVIAAYQQCLQTSKVFPSGTHHE
jgi:hypothetical protein